MKVGFGKKKQKKQKNKAKKGQGADGDDAMADAAPPATSPEPTMEDAPAEVSAKSKQRQRMELKNALKVQVANLKSKRNKLTKLAGNRTERRQLSSELKGLVQGQVSKKKGCGKGKEQHQAAADNDQMAD